MEKESGTIGSTVGEERGGRCRAQMIDGSFRCHVCHDTLSACGPHTPIHTQRAYTHLQFHSHCGSEEADLVVVLLP